MFYYTYKYTYIYIIAVLARPQHAIDKQEELKRKRSEERTNSKDSVSYREKVYIYICIF
jgi:hypothetical protein